MKYDENRIYEYIESQIQDGAPPTVREIAAEFDIKSTAHVGYILRKLAKAGRIDIVPRISRGIRLKRGRDGR